VRHFSQQCPAAPTTKQTTSFSAGKSKTPAHFAEVHKQYSRCPQHLTNSCSTQGMTLVSAAPQQLLQYLGKGPTVQPTQSTLCLGQAPVSRKTSSPWPLEACRKIDLISTLMSDISLHQQTPRRYNILRVATPTSVKRDTVALGTARTLKCIGSTQGVFFLGGGVSGNYLPCTRGEAPDGARQASLTSVGNVPRQPSLF